MGYQTQSSNRFSDLGQAFYTQAVLKANAAGVIQGYGDKIRPLDNITREEAAAMLGRALGLLTSDSTSVRFSDTGSISDWAAGYVNAMANHGYMQGYGGKFNPGADISRAEVVTVLDNSIKGLFNEAKEYTGNVAGSAIVSADGAVLRNMVITGDLIIAQGVGDGNVTLTNVTVQGRTIVRGGGANSIHITGSSSQGELFIPARSIFRRLPAPNARPRRKMPPVRRRAAERSASLPLPENSIPFSSCLPPSFSLILFLPTLAMPFYFYGRVHGAFMPLPQTSPGTE
ncbi:S-layer homology domain-containing protein [Papillibacter cinnamivorans]|uniref:S-layer homology domain-containing protein n=1 Tax=Papillibacter cinnamivorans DSM 12816 TaxID=1122930 RepID=A0A1W1ZQI1_9FIRM|nr:S-layer homology domain-containing protein [Papillibacter cinnamivorans]SMC50800.1 S-layer homology domain-containing protein [Papillibacter cinnamivorans DSM 12816]